MSTGSGTSHSAIDSKELIKIALTCLDSVIVACGGDERLLAAIRSKNGLRLQEWKQQSFLSTARLDRLQEVMSFIECGYARVSDLTSRASVLSLVDVNELEILVYRSISKAIWLAGAPMRSGEDEAVVHTDSMKELLEKLRSKKLDEVNDWISTNKGKLDAEQLCCISELVKLYVDHKRSFSHLCNEARSHLAKTADQEDMWEW